MEPKQIVDTQLCCDACEFSPFSDSNEIVAVGTYQVVGQEDEGGTAREGRVLLFDSIKGTELQRFDCGAVLDLEWSHQKLNEKATLAVADALGNVTLHTLDNDTKKLNQLTNYNNALDKILCLSIDWSNRLTSNTTPNIIVSQSNGDLTLLELTNSSLVEKETWNAHGFEAWIAAFDAWQPESVVYSGGDDCILKVWDMRAGTAMERMKSRKHSAGVCSIQSNPFREHILATGSYDEHILIWDTRFFKNPLHDHHTEGGGVWRIKWHPKNPLRMLTASMHSGFHVIDYDEDYTGSQTVTIYKNEEHGSLAYGADWSYAEPVDGVDHLKGTCSFYDHSFHLWN
ncbi:WD40 repeat-like protein [Rhizoclosmatium globosum]|uniref:methylated diphthine methylhydrolase n=1 Tax=Rhizoclosmatium globosum TaxID=329046 RepID=A0A1Y2CEE5_9FUNG|nr:WD40 repeat-like protein [Rhizoclosmatium globosum]|eukprot:ORY45184.1 WD40 repeat-like protein [Rhizoclosmatium globosum]